MKHTCQKEARGSHLIKHQKELLSPLLSLTLSETMAQPNKKRPLNHSYQSTIQEKSNIDPIERALKPTFLNV
jgi:hypothetical protein